MTGSALADHSAAVIAAGSKSFAAAARLFDRDTRESVTMLYAWCRYCDDQVDGQVLGHGNRATEKTAAIAALDRLHDQTRRVFRGQGHDQPAFAALAEVVRRHGLSEAYALAHLEGYAMDVEGRHYRTLDDTIEYCYRVAGVVGLMMAQVMGVRRATTLDRACDLGIAFQLTNIARDVIEDAAIGRVYLPDDWLTAAEVAADAVAERRYRAALAQVTGRVLAAADDYYASAAYGVSDLPLRSAWAIATAHRVYRAIGVAVLRRGGAAWDERITTSGTEKFGALLWGAAAALTARTVGRLRAAPQRDGLWMRPEPEDLKGSR